MQTDWFARGNSGSGNGRFIDLASQYTTCPANLLTRRVNVSV